MAAPTGLEIAPNELQLCDPLSDAKPPGTALVLGQLLRPIANCQTL